jgi:hypothetical protein
MPIACAMRRYEFAERKKDIVNDRTVGVFIYRDAGCRMGTVNYHIAVANTGLPDDRRHLTCNINEFISTFGAHAQIFRDDFHRAPVSDFSTITPDTLYWKACPDILSQQVSSVPL